VALKKFQKKNFLLLVKMMMMMAKELKRMILIVLKSFQNHDLISLSDQLLEFTKWKAIRAQLQMIYLICI